MSHKRLSRLASLLAMVLTIQMLLAACDLNPSKATPTAPAATATSAAAAASPTTLALAATPTTAMMAASPTAALEQPSPTSEQAAASPTEAMAITPTEAMPVTPTATIDNSAPTVNRPLLSFAKFNVPNVSVKASVAPYTVKPDLSDVANPAQYSLSNAAQALLAKNLFVVSPLASGDSQRYPSGLKEFYQVYEAGRYGDEPVFVTSDSILHVYHLVFDKMLRDLESNKLTGELTILNDAMLRVSDAQHSDVVKLNNPDLTAASERLVAYFAVADKLINPNSQTPAYVSQKVNAEVGLINNHAGIAPSNIFAKYMEDYGQYNPRGHYTRSEALQHYFRAMIWYGRMTFRQQDASETLSAILLSELLGTQQTLRSGPILDHWRNIYEPTVFIVGKADDLSYFDYQPAIKAVYGSDTPALQDLADPAKLTTFQGAIDKMPSPLINSMFVYATQDKTKVTKGLRMMGQRFTLDEYVIGQLTWRNVGTAKPDGNPDVVRWLPRALDVPAAMGSDEALNIIAQGTQLDYGQGQGPAALHYDTQMQKVRQNISALNVNDWTQNLYWSWLYTINSLVTPKPSGYPSFMTNQAWQDKQLTTYLGSYTELKHDTILYAKQSMAELGGGPPTIVKGYVEPQPELYARLSALTQLTIDGLKSRNLLDQPIEQRLTNVKDAVSQMLTISLKELQNQPLTDDEYTFIMYYGGTIEGITISTADPQCDPNTPPDQCQGRLTDAGQFDAALAADIASDPNGNALQETTGRPYEIYAVVPIDGKKVLSRGAVFSHYEFVVPSSGRLTDEAWKAQLDAGKAPAFADWTKSYAIQK
ncbi:MAG: hypothetical protein DLM69_11805 [Candidatus Chloroheliales bacterium]|nr:MAG: hypothetical protein DLM69_11805 [Chloroflexota bacterium]